MLRHEDECVGCPLELGCLGDGCPHMNVPHWFCDECEAEVSREELRILDGKQLCWGCFVEKAWDEAEEPEDES